MALAITFGSLIAVALWELFQPWRRLESPARRRRLGNLGIWLFNIIAAALIFRSLDGFHFWPDDLAGAIAGFLFLDLLSYGIHRAQHAVPVLWRLHALHHSDPDVDFTTSVRHHPFEFLIATGCFWLTIAALGIPVAAAAAHGLAVFILATLTHGNVRWPRWLERALRPVVITLDLHLVHHSIEVAEANSNFGAVFSFWDRLFGTLRPTTSSDVFGVSELPRDAACRPLAMLITPWRIR